MKFDRYADSYTQAEFSPILKRALLGTCLALMIGMAQPFAIASEDNAVSEPQTSSADKTSESSAEKAPASDLVLDNIQDVAYTLQRIRQQAVNIYVESTRKPVKSYDFKIDTCAKVPSTPLEKESDYLPLRKAWLVFFIGTMEPLVQILTEHVKHIDERTKRHNISSRYMPEWQGMVQEWKSGIKQLNEQLDICAKLVDNCVPENVEVAKSAKSIDEIVTQLEDILHRANKFLHDHQAPSTK